MDGQMDRWVDGPMQHKSTEKNGWGHSRHEASSINIITVGEISKLDHTSGFFKALHRQTANYAKS